MLDVPKLTYVEWAAAHTLHRENSLYSIKYSERCQILGRNPHKSVTSFSPCYSQPPLQLCLEISISSNSRNLLQFLHFSYRTLLRRKEENLTENHTPLPNGLRNQYRNLKSEKSQDYAPETSAKLYSMFMNSASVFIYARS